MPISYFLAQTLSQGHLRLWLEMHSSSPRAAVPPAASHLATFGVNQILSERFTRSPEKGCVQVRHVRYILNIYNSNLFGFFCSCLAQLPGHLFSSEHNGWMGMAEIAVIMHLQSLEGQSTKALWSFPRGIRHVWVKPGKGWGLGEGSRRWKLAEGDFWYEEKQMWTRGLSKLPFQAPLPACWEGTFFFFCFERDESSPSIAEWKLLRWVLMLHLPELTEKSPSLHRSSASFPAPPRAV